jgi:hypothetical protein
VILLGHLATQRIELTARVDTDLFRLSDGSSFTIQREELPRVLPAILPHLAPEDRRIWSLMTKNVIVASVTIKSLGGPRAQITLGFISNNVGLLAGLMELGEPT